MLPLKPSRSHSYAVHPQYAVLTYPKEVDSEGKYGRALKALLDQPRNWYTKSIAIVIGIDKYLHMKPLEGCVNDANAVAKLLEEKHEFTVIKLLDREATKENVLKYVLDKLCTSTGWKSIKGDDRTRAIIFFAGHGTQGGHLCPVDYNPENPLSSGISMDGFGLRGFEKELKPHHTLLILDACHASFSFSTAQGRRAMNERREEDLKQRCVEVLASTRSDQEAVEKKHSDGEMRGAFTTALVRALQDEVFEKRNIVDISEVHNFVKEVIEEPPKAQQSQFHRLDGFGSFLFMKKTKSTKSKKVKASPAEVPPSKVAQDVPMPAPPAAAGVVVQAAPSQEK